MSATEESPPAGGPVRGTLTALVGSRAMLPHPCPPGRGSVRSHHPHGRLRGRSWRRPLESTSSPPVIGRHVQSVEEATVTSATRDRQAAGGRGAGGPVGCVGCGRRPAAALLVGTVACSAAPASGARSSSAAVAHPPHGDMADMPQTAGMPRRTRSRRRRRSRPGSCSSTRCCRTRTPRPPGTGMVLTAAGQVLTNYHVVEGAGTITVTVATTGRATRRPWSAPIRATTTPCLQLTGASGLTTVKADDNQAQVGDAVRPWATPAGPGR